MDKIFDIVKDLLLLQWKWIIAPFKGDLSSLNTLIYGNENLYYGIFDEKQFGVVAQGMAVMQSVSVMIILISIVMAGMRISSAGINPANRTSSFEYFKDFALVAILFFNLNTIFELIHTVNFAFVHAFDSAKEIVDGNMLDKAEKFMEVGPVGGLIIGLVLLGLLVWANFYYMMRSLTLMILTIISPLAVALYLIPQTKAITVAVLKEYTGTVFVQSIHAALYWIITSVASEDFGLSSVILYIIFIPVSESIRSLFGLGGDMTNKLTKSAAMMGGAALMGVLGSVKGAMSGKTVAQSLRAAAGQGIKSAKDAAGKGGDEEGSPKTVLGGAGTDIGSTSRAERMLRAGEITSKAGKAVFGAAGAIAGSPMGPLASAVMADRAHRLGGVVGGVAGRAGMAGAEFVGDRLKKGTLAGIKQYKGFKNSESQADEKTAHALAEEETTSWAKQHKEEFMKQNRKDFPDISNEAREQMWNDRVSGKRAEFLDKARQTVGEIKSTNGQFAKGMELAETAASNLSNDWAKNNKEQFMKDYDQKNPIPKDASEGDILKHNQNKNAAWKKAVENKKKQFTDLANNTIEKLGVDNSNVGSKDATTMANDWAKDNKEQFMKDYEKNNPIPKDASKAEQVKHTGNKEAAWKKAVASKKEEYASNLTNEWANNNKEQFFKDYDKKNPLPQNASEDDIARHSQSKEAAWTRAVGNKKKQFTEQSKNTGTSVGSYIKKSDFDKELGKELAVVAGTGEREGIQAVKGATESVKTASLYSTKKVNMDLLQNHIATLRTKNNKNDFIEEKIGEGLTKEQATHQWNTVGSKEAFTENLKTVKNSMPQELKLDYMRVKNNGVRTAGAIVSGAGAFFATTSGIPQAVQQTSSFIGDTKIGMGLKAMPLGLKEAWANKDPGQNPITAGVSAVGAGFKAAGHQFKVHQASNPIEKQAAFRNIIAYGTGIVGGVSGYKAGANWAGGGSTNIKTSGLKVQGFNPYNKAANNQIAEVSEIEHQVQKVDIGNGQMALAPGALRMVTTREKTVIQMKDKSGRVQTVSRIASGDSELKKGQTIYQDLAIQDGQVAPISNVYQEDSGGGRINVTRRINVNPNKIVANRNTTKNPRVVQDVQSLNQLVDSGQFKRPAVMEEISNMTEVRMVVNRQQSYLVGKKDGIDYRLTQYGPGDARLPDNQVVERKVIERNRKLVFEEIDNSYTSSQTPESLLPKVENKRNMNRKNNDLVRPKTMVGSLNG